MVATWRFRTTSSGSRRGGGPYAASGEELAGVLAAEPAWAVGSTCAPTPAASGHTWLALDDAGEPITDRELIRQAASLLALCEVAEESAGGGELDELHSRLVALRLTENPPGIDEAEEAIVGLQQVLGSTPRVATAAWLDEVGAATRRLEETLGDVRPVSVRRGDEGASRAVEDFTTDVEANYKQVAYRVGMEGSFGFPIGGDPEDLMRGLREFAEKQAESVAEAQREQFATLTLNTAVALTAAALSQVKAEGGPTSRRSRCATPCGCSSPRPWRSFPLPGQGFMRE